MQGKGIIKFFLILLAIVCIGQYLFTLPTNRVERDAETAAKNAAAKVNGSEADAVYKVEKARFLDSMSSEVLLNVPFIKKYTYQDLKRYQMAMGLDLKGGMSVVLQVDLQDFLKSMAQNSQDETFKAALETAAQRQKSAQGDLITLFSEEFQKNANGKKLANIFAKNDALKLNYESSDNDVVARLRQLANETVQNTYERLKQRIDEFGVTQPNVSLDAARDLIVVELPGVDNPQRARNMLQATAKLEFWDMYRSSDPGVFPGIAAADKKLKLIVSGDSTKVTPDSVRGPLLSILNVNPSGGATLGYADKNKTEIISQYLDNPAIKALFPRDLEFRWAQKPIADKGANADGSANTLAGKYELYAIKKPTGKDGATLEGDQVTDAGANPDPNGQGVSVSLKMNNKGAKTWGEMTTKAYQDQNRQIGITVDDKVVSAPRVINPILTGDTQITGDFTLQEAEDLAKNLKIGKLPAKTKIIQESVVGPSLGQENITKSFLSMGIGLLAIIGLMIWYYNTAGLIAVIALVINLLLVFGILTSLGTVLTLPGIAGIVLTMASAIDADVIIYERVKEELALGKSTLQAVNDGFKHSMSAIIDANVSNLLIAFVMLYFGLGPIKGFAVVLIIGIFCTLFTAVLVARLLFDWWFGRGKDVKFFTKATEHAFKGINIDWVGMRKKAYMFSAVFILAGVVSFFTRGFDLGVDFTGGYSYNVQFADNTPVTADQLRQALTTQFEGEPIVKSVDAKNTFNITTKYLAHDVDAAEKVMTKLHAGVNTLSPVGIDAFKKQDGVGTHIASFSRVGPTVADDIRKSAFKATFFGLALIFIYILIRFNKWQYSLGAIVALIHDVLLVLSVFTLFHGFLPFSMEIDQAFVAAILTVIGYSMNDTVVVYDRIREFVSQYSGMPKKEVINSAINNTLSRTIMTSFITFLSMFILFLFGGGSIRGFAFALVVGVVIGTYSSIFVATPVMVDLTKDELTDGKISVKEEPTQAAKQKA